MEPQRIRFRFDMLQGWVLDWVRGKETSRTFAKEAPKAIWTVFELADFFEACELVHQIGRIADQHCSNPEIDLRGNLVLARVTTPGVGLTEEDFNFAQAVDLEIGDGQKACGIMQRGDEDA